MNELDQMSIRMAGKDLDAAQQYLGLAVRMANTAMAILEVARHKDAALDYVSKQAQVLAHELGRVEVAFKGIDANELKAYTVDADAIARAEWDAAAREGFEELPIDDCRLPIEAGESSQRGVLVIDESGIHFGKYGTHAAIVENCAEGSDDDIPLPERRAYEDRHHGGVEELNKLRFDLSKSAIGNRKSEISPSAVPHA